jgi:hydrogenase-4 component B
MTEWMIILGIMLHALSGVPGLVCRRLGDGGQSISAGMAVSGSVVGMAGALGSLWFPSATISLIRVDGIAVIFLLPIFLISALGGVYGLGYWSQEKHPRNGRKLRLFYGLVAAGLGGVAVAANSILLMFAWEVMALSAFFLITTEDEDGSVRAAGLLYMIVTHFSTLCLFALVALMWSVTGSFALGPLAAGAVSPGVKTALFWLAVVAFGLKAGLMPLHIWLPSAHSMAPSHVSALMSGVLIKIGIYGLVRVLSWLPGVPPLWWAGVLLGAGAVSGIVGVVLALGQHDLKRLLAYHSIENIGIIVMGLGLAMAGTSLNCPAWVALGLGGALLHVWNHGIFKALLFFSAGSAIQAVHTREMERLGGLARLMPWTAFCFAVGAAAICGLPPLNGFISELLIYLGAFRTLGIGQAVSWPAAAMVAPALALIGGLAVACFVKAFGVVFLGEARSDDAKGVSEAGPAMIGPLLVLAGCCAVIGVVPWLVAPVIDAGIKSWTDGLIPGVPSLGGVAPLGLISLGAASLVLLIGLVAVLFRLRVKRGCVASGSTWGCGYLAPTARMQYTASSFAQIIGALFSWVQRPQLHGPGELAVFPGKSAYRGHILDLVLDTTVKPAYRAGAKFLSSFKFLQAGKIHAYLFYIVVFLIALLLWR